MINLLKSYLSQIIFLISHVGTIDVVDVSDEEREDPDTNDTTLFPACGDDMVDY